VVRVAASSLYIGDGGMKRPLSTSRLSGSNMRIHEFGAKNSHKEVIKTLSVIQLLWVPSFCYYH